MEILLLTVDQLIIFLQLQGEIIFLIIKDSLNSTTDRISNYIFLFNLCVLMSDNY